MALSQVCCHCRRPREKSFAGRFLLALTPNTAYFDGEYPMNLPLKQYYRLLANYLAPQRRHTLWMAVLLLAEHCPALGQPADHALLY